MYKKDKKEFVLGKVTRGVFNECGSRQRLPNRKLKQGAV